VDLGATYLIARALGDNVELSDLAVVVPSVTYSTLERGRLRGVNRLILDEAEKKRK